MECRVAGVGAATIVWMLTSCAGSDSPDEQGRARWDDAKPARYVVQTCTMAIFPPGCVRVAVENGVPIGGEERIYADDLGWEPYEPPADPIDDMFDAVQAGKVDDCTVDDVTYDEVMGFVSSYAFVCDGSVQGGRWVACLVPDTLDLERCDSRPDL